MSAFRALIGCAGLVAVITAPVQARADTARLPMPTDRVETPVADPLLSPQVEETYVKLRHPLAKSVGEHPEACDWIGYLRLRHKDGPADSAKADAVLTMQPGTASGAGGLTIQGNQIVVKAAERGKHVEYWALDRRSNCAEDHTGLEAAKKAHDPKIAQDYYLQGKPVDGKRFAGYTNALAMPYLAHFGMAMALDDWRAVIQQGVPGSAAQRKVFCGGHSYGGFLVGGMLSWDFDGNRATQEDAGYNLCGGGGIPLEGVAMNDPAQLKLFGGLDSIVKLVGGGVGMNAVNAGFTTGALPRTLDYPPIVNVPKLLTTFEIAGLAADYAGDKETDLLKVAAAQPDLMLAMRFLYAPDPVSFATGIPGPGTYRLTGQAALGLLMDNNSAWLQIFQAGLGTFDGGLVTEKTWPAPNVISKIPILGQIWKQGFGFGQGIAPADPGKLYGWRHYDHVGDKDAPKQLDTTLQPITSPDKEPTDLRELAKAQYSAGPADYWEWYFPLRQITDMVFAYGLGRTGDLDKLIYREEGLKKRPILTVLAGDGPIQNVALGNAFLPLVPENRVLVPGYRHQDVVTATAKQNNGKPEQVSTAMVDFALKNAGKDG